MTEYLFANVLEALKSRDAVSTEDLIRFEAEATEASRILLFVPSYALTFHDINKWLLRAQGIIEDRKRKIPRSKPPVSVTAGHTILDYDLGRSMGMITVAANGWVVSHTQSSDFKGTLLSAFKVPSHTIGSFPKVIHHELDNTRYSTDEESARAAYNAGLLDLYYYVG